MARPLVSILICTYNREGEVSLAIQSALGQTYDNIEVVVYDDGSEDNTHAVLGRWHKTAGITVAGSRINRGVGHARNALLELASGDFLAWLDSDDMANQWRIELLLETLRKYDTPFVRSGFTQFSRKEGLELWLDPPVYKTRLQYACATTLVRAKEAKTVPYQEDVIVGEDSIWEKDLMLHFGCPGVYLPLSVYHVGRSSRFHRLNKSYRVEGMEETVAASNERLRQALDERLAQLRERGIPASREFPCVPKNVCEGMLKRCL